MRRFTKAYRLVASVGLDFPVKQSGDTSRRGKHLTKHCSSHLRRSLFVAASVARQHDPYFRSIYDKKRAEGKTYTAAVVAVEQQLQLVTRAVWLSGMTYDASRLAVV